MWKYCLLLALVITPVVKSDIDVLMKSIVDIESRRSPNATQYLAGFLGFVFTGQTQTGGNVFDLIDQVPGDKTIAEMLIIASQEFIQYLINNKYEPEEYEALFHKWTRILFKLSEEGTSAVSLEDLRPFLNMLRPGNLFSFWKRNELQNTLYRLNYFIYYVYLGQIKDPICKNNVALWFASIQKGEFWALSMFDAAGKPGTGLANANINWVGSYKQCRKISVVNKTSAGLPGYSGTFKGRYCRATLAFPPEISPDNLPSSEDFGFKIDLCVPSPCDNEDVQSIMFNTLKLMTIQDFFTEKNVKVLCDHQNDQQNTTNIMQFDTTKSNAGTIFVSVLNLYAFGTYLFLFFKSM